MRYALVAFMCSLLVFRPDAPALGQDQARQVVERAVQALGGLDKLTRPKATIRKVKGSYPGEAFLGQTYSQAPDLLKLLAHSPPGAKTQKERMLLLKGGKGWIRLDGETILLDAKDLSQLQCARHADKVAGLVFLLEDKGFTLSTVGDAKVKDQDTVEIEVKYPGQPDIRLFFDKATGLLAKTWQKFSDSADGGDKLNVHEDYFSQYRILDPVGSERDQLKEATLPTEGPALLKWLMSRTLSAADRAKVAELGKDLASDLFAVRAQAMVKLKKLGPEAGPILKKLLTSTDAEVVQRAKECLDYYAQDPALELIPAALRVLAVERPAGASAALLDYLACAPNNTIRNELQATLFDLAQASASDPDLVKALADGDPLRRSAAQAALGKDGGVFARKPGRRLLIDGVKIAARCELYRNGKLDLELEILNLQFFNALDEGLFTLPK